MNKVLKIAGIVAAILVLLVIAAVVLARILITPERVKTVVLPRVEKMLNREVSLEDVEVSLFSGIQLEQLVVREREGEEPFVTAERMVLSYRLWPLFFRQVVIDEARLVSPRIRVERLPDGSFNFSDLVEGSGEEPQKTDPAEGEGPPVNLLISEVAMTGGELTFIDHQLRNDVPYRLKVEDMRFAAEDISLSAPFPFQAAAQLAEGRVEIDGRIDPQALVGEVRAKIDGLSVVPFTPYFSDQLPGQLNAMSVSVDLTAEGGKETVTSAGEVRLDNIHFVMPRKEGGEPLKLENASLSLDYALAANLLEKVLSLEKALATFNGLPVQASGTVSHFDAEPKADLEIRVDELDLRQALQALPAELTASVKELDPAGRLSARARLKGAVDETETLLQSAEVRLTEVAANLAGARAALNGLLRVAEGALASENLVLTMGENRAEIDLKATDLFADVPHLVARIQSERFALDPLLQASAAPAAAGEEKAPTAPPEEVGPIDLPISAQGSIHIGETVYKGTQLKDFELAYRLQDNVLTVEQLSGEVAGGTLSGQARVDLGQPLVSYTSDIGLKNTQFDSIVSALFPRASGVAFGTLNLQTQMSGKGTAPENIKRNLNATGELIALDGKLTGAGFVEGLAEFLNLEELRVLQFSRLRGNYTVENGEVQINSEVNGQDVRMQPTGTVGLEDFALNISLNPRFSPALVKKLNAGGSFTRFLVDQQGWGKLPIELTGTLTAPRFALDTSALRQEVQEQVGEEVQKRLQEGLQRLLPREREQQAPEDQEKTAPGGDLEETFRRFLGN